MSSDRSTFEQSATPEPAILRLLDSASNQPIDNPELRRELAWMVRLMHRLEALACEQLLQNADPSDSSGYDAEQPVHPGYEEHGDLTADRPAAGFSPAELHGAPREDLSTLPGEPTWREPSASPQGIDDESIARHSQEDGNEERLTRWWVHFNGDVSLERLAKLRTILGESPFAIEARFSEITDGLILMRLLTESQFSDAQIDWIIRQVMDSVGLDRGAAILSRD